MKKIFGIGIAAVFVLMMSACESREVDVPPVKDFSIIESKKNILLIAGEGGPSGSMFVKAAKTYSRKNGGQLYEVHDGDQFIAAVRDFIKDGKKIDHLEYFGHGNELGLYVNQEPGVNGGLYANDPDQDKIYRSASIHELPADVFSKYGWIKVNGCNIAKGYPEVNSLAQSFANYFDVDVLAPLGPTEFSKSPNGVDPYPASNYLDSNFNGDVYMVTSYSDKNFISVKPQERSESGFKDVRKGQDYEQAVVELKEAGLNLDFKDKKFLPYKNVTYAEAQKFCEVALKDVAKCKIRQAKGGELIRNLEALRMLVDAYGLKLKYSNPWYASYIYWAKENNLLTYDFVHKKWYTRGEMALLTWNIMKKQAL